MKQFEIQGETEKIEAIYSESIDPLALLLLGHGAGVGMAHLFMESLAKSLNESQIDVVRFNFPYLSTGKKFPGSPKPDIQAWKDVIGWSIENSQLPTFVGGKSYGGRMASHLLANEEISQVRGIIYFGFPLHAPGKESMDRAKHLDQIKVPQLFLQGSRDALAGFDIIQQVSKGLSNSSLKEITGGDHSFKVKGSKKEKIIELLSQHSFNWIKCFV